MEDDDDDMCVPLEHSHLCLRPRRSRRGVWFQKNFLFHRCCALWIALQLCHGSTTTTASRLLATRETTDVCERGNASQRWFSGKTHGGKNAPLVLSTGHRFSWKRMPRGGGGMGGDMNRSRRSSLYPMTVANTVGRHQKEAGKSTTTTTSMTTTKGPVLLGAWVATTTAAIRRSLAVPIDLGPFHPHQIAMAVTGVGVAVTASTALARSRLRKCRKGSVLENRWIRILSFWKRAGPIVVHYKFTKYWLYHVRGSSPNRPGTGVSLARRDEIWNSLHNRYAPAVKDLMAEFRGLFVKAGQVLSSRADFMPPQYIERFSELQDSLEPRPTEVIRAIVEESLRARRSSSSTPTTFDEIFESFDDTPLGTASIGQVHRAVLRRPSDFHGYTGGPIVAVKVMDPVARRLFNVDFGNLKVLLRIALPGWTKLLGELKRQMMYEFDYNDEARSLLEVRKNMERSPFTQRVVIPQPLTQLCSCDVLVMQMLHGKKVTDHLRDELAEAFGGDQALAQDVIRRKQRELMMKPHRDREMGRTNSTSPTTTASSSSSPWNAFAMIQDIVGDDDRFKGIASRTQMLLKLRQLQNQIRKNVNLLVDVHGHQIFVDGVFNGDPHPGNILILEDGRLGLIDYGQVKRLHDDDRIKLARTIVALSSASVSLSTTVTTMSHRVVADAMRTFGFVTRRDRDDVLAYTAEFFFNSNAHGRRIGIPDPQNYIKYLNEKDQVTIFPPPAVMVARTSFLLRGMGSLVNEDIKTADCWANYAKKALRKHEEAAVNDPPPIAKEA